jgi:hypothetical protein
MVGIHNTRFSRAAQTLETHKGEGWRESIKWGR